MEELKKHYEEQGVPTIELYQLKRAEETDKMRFLSFAFIKKHFGEQIKIDNYDLVYVAPHNGEILGDIWERFNINQPEDYKTYSLSVSDIIVLNNGRKKAAYFVDNYDFIKIPDFFDSASGASSQREMEM